VSKDRERQTEDVLASTLLCSVYSQAEGIPRDSNKLKDNSSIGIPFRHWSSEHFAGGRLVKIVKNIFMFLGLSTHTCT